MEFEIVPYANHITFYIGGLKDFIFPIFIRLFYRFICAIYHLDKRYLVVLYAFNNVPFSGGFLEGVFVHIGTEVKHTTNDP